MTINHDGASGSAFLSQAHLERAILELVANAKERGISEREADSLLRELSDLAASAKLWHEWDTGRLVVARRESTGELEFRPR